MSNGAPARSLADRFADRLREGITIQMIKNNLKSDFEIIYFLLFRSTFRTMESQLGTTTDPNCHPRERKLLWVAKDLSVLYNKSLQYSGPPERELLLAITLKLREWVDSVILFWDTVKLQNLRLRDTRDLFNDNDLETLRDRFHNLVEQFRLMEGMTSGILQSILPAAYERPFAPVPAEAPNVATVPAPQIEDPPRAQEEDRGEADAEIESWAHQHGEQRWPLPVGNLPEGIREFLQDWVEKAQTQAPQTEGYNEEEAGEGYRAEQLQPSTPVLNNQQGWRWLYPQEDPLSNFERASWEGEGGSAEQFSPVPGMSDEDEYRGGLYDENTDVYVNRLPEQYVPVPNNQEGSGLLWSQEDAYERARRQVERAEQLPPLLEMPDPDVYPGMFPEHYSPVPNNQEAPAAAAEAPAEEAQAAAAEAPAAEAPANNQEGSDWGVEEQSDHPSATPSIPQATVPWSLGQSSSGSTQQSSAYNIESKLVKVADNQVEEVFSVPTTNAQIIKIYYDKLEETFFIYDDSSSSDFPQMQRLDTTSVNDEILKVVKNDSMFYAAKQ